MIEMADTTKHVNTQEIFSFIRFAEYRPQTFTSDLTFEIPTLAQYITDETFQPVNLVLYLELTSLTIKNVSLICERIEELLSVMFTVGKETFHTFPPIKDSFTLTIHLLIFFSKNSTIQSINRIRSHEQMQNILFKGFGRDLEKWIILTYDSAQQDPEYNPSKWNFLQALSYIKEDSNNKESGTIKNINLLILSCWDTENSFDDVMQSVESFEESFVPWYYLFTITPSNSMTTALADLLSIPLYNLLVDDKSLANMQLYWKNTLLKLLEPVLEVKIKPTELGSKYSIATNLTVFQNQKILSDGLVIYKLQSQRYPIRINFLFNLPVQDPKSNPLTDPIILESLEMQLKTSTGNKFKEELLKDCITYKLPLGESEYQPERELNNRMRRGEKLKRKLESILQQQSELNVQIKKLIIEPKFLEEMLDEETIKESIENLKIAFEIVNYLQEQELLLAEMPPTAKMFQPPRNGSLLI